MFCNSTLNHPNVYSHWVLDSFGNESMDKRRQRTQKGNGERHVKKWLFVILKTGVRFYSNSLVLSSMDVRYVLLILVEDAH